MANQKSSQSLPKGWEFVKKFKKAGSGTSYYLCPATGQQFFTYKELMQYVTYAKANKLSIYSPTFTTEKQKRKAVPGRKRKLTGESSKSSAINEDEETTDAKKNHDLVENIDLAEAAVPAQGSNETSLLSHNKTDNPPNHSEFLAEKIPIEEKIIMKPQFDELAYLDCDATSWETSILELAARVKPNKAKSLKKRGKSEESLESISLDCH